MRLFLWFSNTVAVFLFFFWQLFVFFLAWFSAICFLFQTNILSDGSLIDLCGATLLWRSTEGLSRSPTPRQLERALDELNAGRPQCPVGLHTLIVPRKNSQNVAPEAQPLVYLKCGHVQVKKAEWARPEGPRERSVSFFQIKWLEQKVNKQKFGEFFLYFLFYFFFSKAKETKNWRKIRFFFSKGKETKNLRKIRIFKKKNNFCFSSLG